MEFLINDITTVIESLSRSSKSLRGTTAFWTLRTDFFSSSEFMDLLSEDESFFIVDISEPTMIENVVDYAAHDSNMYFYLKRAKDSYLKYNHLLHSKLLLFESEIGDDYTLLIGSANMTGRALKGINQEAGVMISLTSSDVLLHEVMDYLNRVKADSVKVDPGKIDTYRYIQDQGNFDGIYENCPLLYLVARNNEYESLTETKFVQLLGVNDGQDFSEKIKSLTSRIALLVENYDTQEYKICICDISSTGIIDEEDTYGKNHEERLFFYLGLSGFTGACTPSVLHPEDEITKAMFYFSDYHAELQVIETYKFAYKRESLKKEISPWEHIETIEDFSIQIPVAVKKDEEEFDRIDERNYRNNKIQIEQINKEYLNDGFIEKLKEKLSPEKLKLERLEPTFSDSTYIEENLRANGLVKKIEFSESAKNELRDQINSRLVQLYNDRKQEGKAAHKNIKLFRPSMIYVNDKINL